MLITGHVELFLDGEHEEWLRGIKCKKIIIVNFSNMTRKNIIVNTNSLFMNIQIHIRQLYQNNLFERISF